ncbi:hypothetical protein [Microbispora sp. H10830]|uniref:hypothetical protein n=1 Tax=Microbispora sp. H10830 TaxID=2729109 RepID=UPI00160392D1|nr:hypothetical protein [Microbispora sp. H10830]
MKNGAGPSPRTARVAALIGALLLGPGAVVATTSPAMATATAATAVTSCSNPNRKVEIMDSRGFHTCFTGTGYLGYRINGVSAVSSLDWGWMKMYLRGSTDGWFEDLRGDGKWYYYPANHDITQICVHC